MMLWYISEGAMRKPCEWLRKLKRRLTCYVLQNAKFIDHISNEFEQQFTGLSAKCGKLIGLVPTVLMSEDVEPDFEEVLSTHTDDLPSPELFHHELFSWKLYLSDKFDDNLPSSIAETIKICDQAYFQNIYVLLQIAATIPATSCECEVSLH